MDSKTFIKVIWPIWAIELVLGGLYHAFGPEEVTTLSNVLMFVSSVLLPFIAGLLIVRAGGNIGLAVFGGVSISAASIIVVAVSYLVTSAGFMEFFGFFIATLMFSVVPKALFGAVGGVVGRKVYAKTT